MHAYLFTILFIYVYIVPINAEAAECDETPGYYWRDYYTGDIPKDALPGGYNTKGHTTYIGQVLHSDKIIPAKIDPDDKKVYYEFGYKEYVAYQSIKILCTKHPEQFEWIKTGNKHINSIKDKNFVVAGYEAGNTPLVGRVQWENELALGKVVFTNTQSTLNTSKDGVGFQHTEFEVLCYNSTIDNKTTKEKKYEKPVIINFYYQ